MDYAYLWAQIGVIETIIKPTHRRADKAPSAAASLSNGHPPRGFRPFPPLAVLIGTSYSDFMRCTWASHLRSSNRCFSCHCQQCTFAPSDTTESRGLVEGRIGMAV